MKATNYLRDASANVMTIYKDTVAIEVPVYGSARLGEYKGGVVEGERSLGHRKFELSNHLGNVLAVITDNVGMVQDSVWATVVSVSDYYPFGLEMKGRSWSDTTSSYRYGFNGKEKDNSFASTTSYDYGFRIYDPSIGRFKSGDPLTKDYPMLTPYQFASNTPLQAIDLDGLERLDMTDISSSSRTAKIKITKVVQIVSTGLPTELTGMSNATFASKFKPTTVYVRNLPENGKPVDFITQTDYNNGIGFSIDINFDMSLKYIANSSAAVKGPEYSTVSMASSGAGFSSNMAFANSSITPSNNINVNPSFDVFSTNGGVSIKENYEELIAHEAGFHNMMGKLHMPNSKGAAIYPTTTTLESNIHNKIESNNNDVQEMLRTNVQIRQRLNTESPPLIEPDEYKYSNQ